MSEEEHIIKKIEDLYQLLDDKGARKNLQFFSHLFKAYYPLDKIKLVNVEPQNKNNFICVFSKKKISVFNDKNFSKDEQDEISDLFKKIKEEGIIMLGDDKTRKVSLVGDKTNTLCSLEGLFCFYKWLKEKVEIGDDKHFKWLLLKENKKNSPKKEKISEESLKKLQEKFNKK